MLASISTVPHQVSGSTIVPVPKSSGRSTLANRKHNRGLRSISIKSSTSPCLLQATTPTSSPPQPVCSGTVGKCQARDAGRGAVVSALSAILLFSSSPALANDAKGYVHVSSYALHPYIRITPTQTHLFTMG